MCLVQKHILIQQLWVGPESLSFSQAPGVAQAAYGVSIKQWITVETVSDFFLSSKITADGDCNQKKLKDA